MGTTADKSERGFTLVELMVVVAIVGILAAISIPQFAEYRIRGFNSSAVSDLRNLATAQEGFFAATFLYAVTYDIGDGPLTGPDIKDTGDLLIGPGGSEMVIAQWSASRGEQRLQPLSLGSGVAMAANVFPGSAVSYVAASKHLKGNMTYGTGNYSRVIYRDPQTLGSGDGGDVNPVTDLIPSFGTDTTEDLFAAVGSPWVAQ